MENHKMTALAAKVEKVGASFVTPFSVNTLIVANGR